MQTISSIPIVDKTKEIEALKKKYGLKYYFNKKAHQEAATLWGISCNEHGVVSNTNEETLVKFKSCKGTMSLAETKKGYWLLGLNSETAIEGYSYSPSVWDTTGFSSYKDAKAYSVEALIMFFEEAVLSVNSCSSKQNKDNAQKAVELLRTERNPQLSLF